MEVIPIVTLDKIYIAPDEENIFFLDCTRVEGTNEIESRRSESIDEQIKRISEQLGSRKIVLADDVVFSGTVLRLLIDKLKKYNIEVIGIISSISTEKGYEYFNRTLCNGLKCSILLRDGVIDQICERDFFFGIAGSGIKVRTPRGIYKAPYFKPYGNPNIRASIPKEYESFFSKGCLERSIKMWEEIDRLKGKRTLMKELPERIINTNDEDEVVKVLKKEIRRI